MTKEQKMEMRHYFTAGIFYTAFLAFLLTGIGFIISPLKSDIKENKVAIQNVRSEICTTLSSTTVPWRQRWWLCTIYYEDCG